MGNNRLAWWCGEWLRERGEEIAALVVHPPDRRRFGDELISTTGIAPGAVFSGDRLRDPETLAKLRAVDADIALSVLFDYILRPELIDLFPAGVVNLHPSLLPYNRGQYPNVWSIVEGTPAGVTLHYIDAGIDTGDIIAQCEVPVAPTDTGETLYRRLESAGFGLFRATWPGIRAGTAPRHPQRAGEGTYHRKRDVEQIDEIDLDREYRAGDLINTLRARTFPPHEGAYFHDGNQKIYLRLELLLEDELKGDA